MDGRKIVCNLKAFSSRDEPTERNHPALLHRLLLCAALLFWFIVTALISLISSHSRQLYQRESSDKPMYLPSIKQQATSWDKLAKRLIFPSSHSELAGPDLVWVPFIRWTNKYKCGCFLRAAGVFLKQKMFSLLGLCQFHMKCPWPTQLNPKEGTDFHSVLVSVC